jgi:PAS domain-containing protein
MPWRYEVSAWALIKTTAIRKAEEILSEVAAFKLGLIMFLIPLVATLASLQLAKEQEPVSEVVADLIADDEDFRSVLALLLESSHSVSEEDAELWASQLISFGDMAPAPLQSLRLAGVAGWTPTSSQHDQALSAYSFSSSGEHFRSDPTAFTALTRVLKKAPGLPETLQLRRVYLSADSLIAVSTKSPLGCGFDSIHCWLESDDETASIRPAFYVTLFLHAPTLELGWHFANFIYLTCVAIVLWIFYRHRPVTEKMYFKMFRFGVDVMALSYLLFLLPIPIAVFTSVQLDLHDDLITRMVRLLLPDVPLFLLAGIILLRGEKHRFPVIFWIAPFVAHYALNFMDLRHCWLQIDGSLSIFDTHNRFIRELVPQLYATSSLLLVGAGLYDTGRRMVRDDGATPPFLRHLMPLIFLTFLGWGLYQTGYFFRDKWSLVSFFQLIFALKVIGISGFLLFTYLQSVADEQKRRVADIQEAKDQAEMLQEVAEKSPNLIICLNARREIEWCSEPAASLLHSVDDAPDLSSLVYDAHDYNWLLSNLIIPRKRLENFEFVFTNKSGNPLSCITSFFPGSGKTQSLTDILVARPIEQMFFQVLEEKRSYHVMKNKVRLCRTWFNQFVDFLKDNVGYPYPDTDRRVARIRQSLDKLEQQFAFVGYRDPALSGESRSDLSAIVGDIERKERSRSRWPHIVVDFPKFAEVLPIRAKSGIVRDIIEELLDNANRKFTSDKEGQVQIRVEELSFNKVVLEFCDSGGPFSPETLEILRAETEPPSPSEKFGLRAAQFHMRLFGGDLRIENKKQASEVVPYDRPTVYLEFWRMESSDNVRPENCT